MYSTLNANNEEIKSYDLKSINALKFHYFNY